MTGERKRTIKLFCPSLSKLTQLVAWEDQRLDLGSIARTFGLDPASLKLNGHFIGRGADLLAASVTWKSLISFFSARGLSTGSTDSDALLVDGKLSRVGTKRSNDPPHAENGISSYDAGSTSFVRNSQLEDAHLWGIDGGTDKITSASNDFGQKRKLWLDSSSSIKRTRMDDGSDLGFKRRENVPCGTTSK